MLSLNQYPTSCPLQGLTLRVTLDPPPPPHQDDDDDGDSSRGWECYRLIRVPASISLAKFHDKVLTAVLGWARCYHGYVFEDPKDGSVFGPSRYSNFIDMMHVARQYKYVADDRKVPLAALLRDVGDVCHYTYDLGDQFSHTIYVTEVVRNMDVVELPDHPMKEFGTVALLDGEGPVTTPPPPLRVSSTREH